MDWVKIEIILFCLILGFSFGALFAWLGKFLNSDNPFTFHAQIYPGQKQAAKFLPSFQPHIAEELLAFALLSAL